MSLDFRVAMLPYKSSSFATPLKRGHYGYYANALQNSTEKHRGKAASGQPPSLSHYLTNLYPFMIPYISASAQPMGMESQMPVTPISGKEERT